MKRWLSIFVNFLFLFCLINLSCAQKLSSRRIIKLGKTSEVRWSEKDLKKEIVVKLLESNEHCSILLIRLNGSEKPHVHEHHSLSVYVLKGESSIIIEGKEVDLFPGDFVTIPKGTIHWAKNKGDSPAEVIAVFSPPYKGKDIKLVNIPK